MAVDTSLWNNVVPSWHTWADQLDPTNERASSWRTLAGNPQYDYGQPSRGGVEFDPLPRGETFQPFSMLTSGARASDAGIAAWDRLANPQNYTFSDPNGSSTNPGQIGSPATQKWASVNAWDSQVIAATRAIQLKTGVYVPPNVVKSIMKIESDGIMLPANSDGAVGLMQLTQSTMGTYDYAKLSSDPAYNILSGVEELALRYQDAQAKLGGKATWDNAIVGYFSGHYVPTGASDAYNSDYAYQSAFQSNMTDLGATKTGGSGGTQARPNTTLFNSIWGGFDGPISQEFGPTDFSNGNGLYNYGADYTRNGQPMGHPGVDVGISYGTPLYSPVNGVVTMAGGTGFYRTTPTDNPNDAEIDGPGMGELMITIPGGDELILGHMNRIGVRIGDAITAGQPVGLSGASNGAHVHVEYRKYWGPPGTVTSSGYEVIDPRLALTGNFTGTYGQSSLSPIVAAGAAGDWQSFMRAAASGEPFSGGFGAIGGFHDYMKQQLGITGGVPTAQTNTGPPLGWTFGYGANGPAAPKIG
jgi:murein DD-endopeptidase MepM/ murein hydrolase activator NlpD